MICLDEDKNKKRNLGNGESRTPLLLQDVEANASVAVNVGMEHLRPKGHLYVKKTIR